MNQRPRQARRDFLLRLRTACGGLALPAVLAIPLIAQEREKGEEKDAGEEISPAEDLMREHGVLNRLLLIYEEHRRRLEAKQDFDPAVLTGAAGIVRHFVEDYHEKLEEDYLFPRFRKAGKLIDLVETLLQQHQAGRRLTALIQQLAVRGTAKDEANRRQLSGALGSFIRMYRPHEAREDTVLFPALPKIVSPHELGALGEEFEKKEDQLFGDEGYFKVVDQVAALEKKLGIHELAQFTPR
jgi:hemerythrin-like domain-containing protein